MAFRASNAVPAREYERAKSLGWQVRQLAANRSGSFATGANAAEVLSAVDNLRSLRVALVQVASTPGIAAYAQAQEDDPAYDVAAEFSALLAAIDSAVTTVVNAVPKDANGYLLVNNINPDGTLVPREFSGAALSGVRAALDAIVAAVE